MQTKSTLLAVLLLGASVLVASSAVEFETDFTKDGALPSINFDLFNDETSPRSAKILANEASATSFLEMDSESTNTNTMFARAGRKRSTEDGRECAQSFQQNGKVYTDCTMDRSPDGKNTGKEWCYVDANAGGDPNWGFCKAILDYDKVRVKVKDTILEMIAEIRRINSLLHQKILPCHQLINAYNRIKQKHDEIDARLNVALNDVKELFKNMEVLLSTKAKWEQVEKDIDKLKGEIEELEKIDQQNNPMNCEGLLGYESDLQGDGIVGKYFDNEAFLGSPKERQDETVDFSWSNEQPFPGISHENFSTKWTGYVLAPVSGKYKFKVVTDDGGRLKLNKQMLISHNMGDISVESKDGGWLDQEQSTVLDLLDPEARRKAKTGELELISKEVSLHGGDKYKIELEYYHSVHNEYDENGEAYIGLWWESDSFPMQPVPPNAMFTKNSMPPLKISGYRSANMTLATFRERDNAFKDSNYYKLADIPLIFWGLPMLRVNTFINGNEVNFALNRPATVYVAYNGLQNNPLPDDFKNMNEVFSVLEVPPKKSDSKKINARVSLPFKIYKKNFGKGDVVIPITQTAEQSKGVSLVIFVGPDLTQGPPMSCGGKEESIALTNGDNFESCAASSEFPNGEWKCEYAFSGKNRDEGFGMWATDGEGIGAWIEVKFKKVFQINKFQYKNRENPSERNSEVEAIFSDGSSQKFSLLNTADKKTFELDTVYSNSIKFVVKGVYGTVNNGGAFEIFGTPCEEEEKVEELGKNAPDVKMRCDHTINTKKDLQKKSLKPGDVVSVVCPSSCADEDIPVYGDQIYADESGVCKAAFHAGALGSDGGKVKLIINRGQSNYAAKTNNGITSESKGKADRSISFEKIDSAAALMNAFVGMKVDILDKNSNDQGWLPGTVIKVDKQGPESMFVTVSKDGYTAEFDESFQWPDENRAVGCGQKIKNRECPQANAQGEIDPTNLKIAFLPSSKSAPQGFLADNGLTFGAKGSLVYGWSKDMRQNARTRDKNENPLLDNLILFPPDAKSQWCQSKNPPLPCEPVNWSVQVPNGKYQIKLTMGDPDNQAFYALKINDKYFAKDQELKVNQFSTPSEVIEVTTGQIVMTSGCDSDCYNVWSRVNAIEIKPGEGEEGAGEEEEVAAKPLGCGNAYTGGRCDDGSDPKNCLYQDSQASGLQACGGALHVVRVGEKYECADQRGKYKCISVDFGSVDECRQDCPGECIGKICETK